jgi:hypothetical protein
MAHAGMNFRQILAFDRRPPERFGESNQRGRIVSGPLRISSFWRRSRERSNFAMVRYTLRGRVIYQAASAWLAPCPRQQSHGEQSLPRLRVSSDRIKQFPTRTPMWRTLTRRMPARAPD